MPGFTSGYIYGDPASHHLGYSVNMLPPQNGLHVQADVGGMPFAFKKRIERIDWRKIASIDVDRVARDLDFGTLQENIMNLTFCNIESEVDVTTMDPNFTKLFKIAQLTIEYLLHSQDYLTSAMACHEEKLQKSFDQSEDLQKQLAVRKQELVDVKRECHKRKKLLVAQQQILQAGPDTYNKCPFCQKAFLSQSFLQSHIVRRHGEYSSAYGLQPATVSAASMSPTGSGNEILEKELREIKERLHATETQLHSERESLKHLLIEKESTKEIIHEKESSQIELEHWKEDQIHQQKEELESVRHMFMKELKEMNEKYQMSEQALFELQHKYGRKSNLGQLQDDNDDGKNDFLSSQKEEINQLKEQLKDQINLVESSVRTRFDDQDKRLKNKVKSMAQQHAQELKRLSSALEHTSLLLREEKEKHGEKAEKYESAIEELLQQSRDQEKILRDMHTDDDDDDEVEKLINESQTKSQRNELVTRQNHVKSAIKKKNSAGYPSGCCPEGCCY